MARDFFYIPGTDTCIKLGGYLRADLTVNGQIYDGPFYNGEGGIRDRYANFYNDRSRLALTIDTRTATEYGVVRTFGQADFHVQYTWQFGNGVSATIGMDDSSANNFNRTQIINAVGGAAGGNGFSGAASSFITGVGTAYCSRLRGQCEGRSGLGAVHDDHAAYFSNANIIGTTFNGAVSQAGAVNFGHPDDKYGGAVSAALQIKNIPTGAGDDIKMDATWSLGASKYVLATSSSTPSSFDIYSGTRFAMGVVTDSIYSGISAVNGRARPSSSSRAVGAPWRVQPQLGSLLVDQPVRRHRRAEL
jgi:hypothetical protein